MVVYVGIDDTDSLNGQCTTYLASEIVARVRSLNLIGYPRLVRLNPNIPWKTRGNGALCLRFGKGHGSSFEVGKADGREVRSHLASQSAAPTSELLQTCKAVLMELTDWEDEDVQPGLVVTRKRPGPGLYWRCVRDVVSEKEIEPHVADSDFHMAPRGSRGLIGALAAISWRPHDRTYEVLAYREPCRWGSRRGIVEEDVMALDTWFPSTFNNYDFEEEHVALAPNSPCPVLLGIRGDDPDDLPVALSSLRTEPVYRWLLFETNQGTDEHLVPSRVSALSPNTSAVVEGEVIGLPRTVMGGHVVFPLEDDGVVDCIAYEPTKSFRRVVLALVPGDKVRVYGSVRSRPRSVNLEKLAILKLNHPSVKMRNPTCPDCGKRMKSVGSKAGYRCRRCETRAPQDAALFVKLQRTIEEGFYEPPVSARRHIGKPLKRMGLKSPATRPPQLALETALKASSKMSSPSSSSPSSIVRAGR